MRTPREHFPTPDIHEAPAHHFCNWCGDEAVSADGEECAACMTQALEPKIPRCGCGAILHDEWPYCSSECELQAAKDAAADQAMDADRLETP